MPVRHDLPPQDDPQPRRGLGDVLFGTPRKKAIAAAGALALVAVASAGLLDRQGTEPGAEKRAGNVATLSIEQSNKVIGHSANAIAYLGAIQSGQEAGSYIPYPDEKFNVTLTPQAGDTKVEVTYSHTADPDGAGPQPKDASLHVDYVLAGPAPGGPSETLHELERRRVIPTHIDFETHANDGRAISAGYDLELLPGNIVQVTGGAGWDPDADQVQMGFDAASTAATMDAYLQDASTRAAQGD